jgi:hypothetical protein
MNRRGFAIAAAAAFPAAFSRVGLAVGTEDIEEGCEGAVVALKGWIEALAARDFDYLERILATDFVFTGPPVAGAGGKVMGGVRDKEQFIETDRKIYNAEIQFLSLTARRMGDLVVTLVLAKVYEEFRGDTGPGMPPAAELNALMQGAKFGYASGWRYLDERWQCTSHHILGQIDRT